MDRTEHEYHPAPAGSTPTPPELIQHEDAVKQTTEHEPHLPKTGYRPAPQDHPNATSPIERPPLHLGTVSPTLRKTAATVKIEIPEGSTGPSSQAEAALTPQYVS